MNVNEQAARLGMELLKELVAQGIELLKRALEKFFEGIADLVNAQRNGKTENKKKKKSKK